MARSVGMVLAIGMVRLFPVFGYMVVFGMKIEKIAP
jgi:hypothetical protein